MTVQTKIFLISALALAAIAFLASVQQNPQRGETANNSLSWWKTAVFSLSNPVADLQQKVIQTTNKTLPNVFSVIITKNLKYLLEDPFSFYPMRIEQKPTKIGEGSAIYLQDGYLITNKHVANDLQADYTVVDASGQTFHIDSIWHDPILDLAILHAKDLNKPSNTANIVDWAKSIPIGNFVLAIGNALGEYQNTVTFWIISNKGRVLKQRENQSVYIGLYQTDTAINPWNSWGPLVDVNDSKIIGVNTAISVWWEWIGFSIPVNRQMIMAMLKSIEQYGKIVHPFLWVAYQSIDDGYQIKEVLPQSAAAKSGIQPGGTIIAINSIPVDPTYPLIYYLYQFLPEDTIVLTIKYPEKVVNVKVRLE